MYCVSSDRESCHCSCITGDESLTVIAFPRLALKTPPLEMALHCSYITSQILELPVLHLIKFSYPRLSQEKR